MEGHGPVQLETAPMADPVFVVRTAIRPRPPFLGMAVLAVLLGGASLRAHDLWIEPTSFAPKAGEMVGARLRVGQDFIGDPLRRDDALIDQFVVETSADRKPVGGRRGADPAGVLRADAPGMLVVGYSSVPSVVDETAEKFAQYVRDEGLEAVAALRARRGETGGTRELFSRCAKSLVLVGPPSATDGDRALGFVLELVAEKNPYTMTAGQVLPVQLTYQARPLAGALVVAMQRDDPAKKISARTDASGRVRLALPEAGVWMVKAVHMIPAVGRNAEWESFWASLTFELR